MKTTPSELRILDIIREAAGSDALGYNLINPVNIRLDLWNYIVQVIEILGYEVGTYTYSVFVYSKGSGQQCDVARQISPASASEIIKKYMED